MDFEYSPEVRQLEECLRNYLRTGNSMDGISNVDGGDQARIRDFAKTLADMVSGQETGDRHGSHPASRPHHPFIHAIDGSVTMKGTSRSFASPRLRRESVSLFEVPL